MAFYAVDGRSVTEILSHYADKGGDESNLYWKPTFYQAPRIQPRYIRNHSQSQSHPWSSYILLSSGNFGVRAELIH